MSDDKSPYCVVENAKRYQVQDAAGQVLVECRDPHSARHYAALLNQAYRYGYRAGYRARKQV